MYAQCGKFGLIKLFHFAHFQTKTKYLPLMKCLSSPQWQNFLRFTNFVGFSIYSLFFLQGKKYRNY